MSDPINCCNTVKETEGAFHGYDCLYWCAQCGRRKSVSCSCTMTFAERMKSIGIDRAALRRFHKGK